MMHSSERPDSLDTLLAAMIEPGARTVAVMVSSVDGRATIDGRVGALTGEPDQRALLTVREHAAAVVVGSGTKQAEGYDGLLDDHAQARRVARGLPPEPELVVLSRQGPTAAEAFTRLRERHPDALISSEGGPTQLGIELAHGLIDELLLCISPKLVGGDSEKRIVEHAAPLRADLELLGTAEHDGFAFHRYRVKRPPPDRGEGTG